jgi:hypothetical protein
MDDELKDFLNRPCPHGYSRAGEVLQVPVSYPHGSSHAL